jgi:hypothetical protein
MRCAAGGSPSALSAEHCTAALCPAESCEERLFAAILAGAADGETLLPTLYADAVRLAYPARADEEVRLAVSDYERYLANPPQGVDKFGNPLWIRLAPSSSGTDRKGRDASADALRRQADSADEEEAPAPGRSKRHFLRTLFSRPKKAAEESLEESSALHSYGDTGRSRVPVRLIRAAVFVTLFAVLYYCFTIVF